MSNERPATTGWRLIGRDLPPYNPRVGGHIGRGDGNPKTSMRHRSLRFKVALYLGIALCGVMVLFTLLVAWYQRNELLDTVASHVTQLSNVVTRSTRFAMLQNQPAYIDRMIADMADEPGIDKIRIFS